MLYRAKSQVAFVLFATQVLSACGGATTASNPVLEIPANPRSNLLSFESNLADEVAATSFTIPVVALAVGSATYNGVLTGTINHGHRLATDLAGELSITTEFSASSRAISGEVKNFVDSEGQDIDGLLNLQNGLLDASVNPNVDHTISGDLVGTIAIDGSENFDVSLDVEGDFFGANAQLVAGGVAGIVWNESEISTMSGRFVASQNTE